MVKLTPQGPDPRTTLSADALEAANARAKPNVGVQQSDRWLVLGGIIVVGFIGQMTFSALSDARQASAAPTNATPPAASQAKPSPLANLPPTKPATKRETQVFLPTQTQAPVAPAPFVPPVVAYAPPPQPYAATPAPVEDANRRRAPALVLDVGMPEVASTAGPISGAAGNGDRLSREEQFADRVARAEMRAARAVRLDNPSAIVQQGTIIAGVLETAINSDLPGFVRAIVSQDVRSFDGSRVLVPRGSRLIGQYRSGLTVGQSRAFVIWTRLIRPDGVSVQIASPTTDTLGQAGLGGVVDTRFFRRFGAAILLSVIGAGLDSLANNNDNDIVIRNSEQAQNVASIALEREINIPPRIRVAQGTPIRIFTTRDLDFSTGYTTESATGQSANRAAAPQQAVDTVPNGLSMPPPAPQMAPQMAAGTAVSTVNAAPLADTPPSNRSPEP
jgi:type IV secretory pathway VirB10-like protein